MIVNIDIQQISMQDSETSHSVVFGVSSESPVKVKLLKTM